MTRSAALRLVLTALAAALVATTASAHPKPRTPIAGSGTARPTPFPGRAQSLSCLSQGDAVMVEWHGSHWKAEVLSGESDSVSIHYTGWGKKWDEVVPSTRVSRARAGARMNKGEHVLVEWKGSYWHAHIKKVDAKRGAFIHYDGWGSEWDEWAAPSRLLTPVATVCRAPARR